MHDDPLDLGFYSNQLRLTMHSNLHIDQKIAELTTLIHLLSDDPRTEAIQLKSEAEQSLHYTIDSLLQCNIDDKPDDMLSELGIANLLFNTALFFGELENHRQEIKLYKKLIPLFMRNKDIDIVTLVAKSMLNHALILEQEGKHEMARSQYCTIIRKFEENPSVRISKIVDSALLLSEQ